MEKIWSRIKDEIKLRVEAEPSLGSYLYSLFCHRKISFLLLHPYLHQSFMRALTAMDIRKFLLETYLSDIEIQNSIVADLEFIMEQDPACKYLSTPLLFIKVFLAYLLQSSHHLWSNDRHTLALFLQGRTSEVFGLDIHPAAKIGSSVMIDHATGVVIGETSNIGSKVSIFQGLLGGKEQKPEKTP